MRRVTLVTASTLLISTFSVSTAMALSEISEEVEERGRGFVGLGIGAVPDYEGSDDSEGTIAPFGRYNWDSGRYISLGGTSGAESAARVKFNALTKDTPWELGPVLQFRLERDDVDNEQVDRMADVDSATELGAFLGWQAGRLSFSTTLVADVSDEHDGSLWYVNGGYDLIQDSPLQLTLRAHFTWADDDYMETYFGVNAADAASSGLPTFSAESGVKDVGLSLIGFYKFNPTWGVAGALSYTRMLGDAEDSPLVDGVGDENQMKAFLAVTYSF